MKQRKKALANKKAMKASAAKEKEDKAKLVQRGRLLK